MRVDIYLEAVADGGRDAALEVLVGTLQLSRERAEQVLTGLPGYVLYGVEGKLAQRYSQALRARGAQVELRQHRESAAEGSAAGGPASQAAPAAHARAERSRQPASPPRRLEPRKRAVIVALCGAIALGCFAYVFVSVRDALREPSEKERIARRLMPADLGYFSTAEKPGFISPYPSPDSSCSAAALPELRRAEALGMEWQLDLAAEPAERALEIDPDCVPAANILLLAHAKRGDHIRLRGRFISRAGAEPENGAAQLQAAFYQREAGNPQEQFAYLERARKARPGLPLLDGAFGRYFITAADPLDYGRALEHFEREVERSGSLLARQNLIFVYGTIGDLEAGKRHCDAFYSAFPESTLSPTAFGCTWVTIKLGDRAAEKVYLERFWRARDLVESCRHGYLAGMYVEVEGRSEDALREADLAIAQRCVEYGVWPKVDALLQLRRYDEAAAVSSAARPRSNHDRWLHAMALALAGDVDEAALVARGSMRTRHPAGGTTKEENLEDMHVLRELLATSASSEVLEAAYRRDGLFDPADHLGSAACGYLDHAVYERGARLVDDALARDPKSRNGWACKVFSLALDERHEQAAEAGERAVALGVVDPTLENNLGFEYVRLGQYQRALPHFERAREIDPMFVRAYGNQALCLRELGRNDEADAARRFVPYPEVENIAWWWFVVLAVVTLALYFLGKLTLIHLLPARFGHLRFP